VIWIEVIVSISATPPFQQVFFNLFVPPRRSVMAQVILGHRLVSAGS